MLDKMNCVYDDKGKLILFSGHPCIKKHCHIQQQKETKTNEQCLVTHSLFQMFKESATKRQLQFVENGLAICIAHFISAQTKFIRARLQIPCNLELKGKNKA